MSANSLTETMEKGAIVMLLAIALVCAIVLVGNQELSAASTEEVASLVGGITCYCDPFPCTPDFTYLESKCKYGSMGDSGCKGCLKVISVVFPGSTMKRCTTRNTIDFSGCCDKITCENCLKDCLTWTYVTKLECDHFYEPNTCDTATCNYTRKVS